MSDVPKTIYLKDYKVPSFLVPEIHLTFELGETETLLTTTLKFIAHPESDESKETLFLNGENLNLVRISRNGIELQSSDYELSDKGLLLKNCPEEFNLETQVRLEPHLNKAFSGLYKTKTVFCTQMEAQGFRRTTFFMDRPDVLSKYTTTLIADKSSYPILLSNGNCVETLDLENGKHKAVWKDPFPKPCYLFALVAGDLDWIEDSFLTRSKRKVDLKIFVDKGKKERARFAMDSLKQSMKWDEDTYRLEYDLDIYNIVAVDDFNMGAMENKGLNIFNSKYVLASSQTATDDEYQAIQRVIGHEYFHNWTGNRVTCRDWFQLSLKEGLTVFRDQEFSSDMNSRPVKRIEDVALLRARQFPEDSGPMAHPVRPSSYIAIDNFYTVTIYEKGAEVIRMLHTLLGANMFKKGVAKYFELFDGQAVTTDDWVKAMEVVSGRDLSQFKLWYDQAGTPQISVSTSYDPQKQTLDITLTQKTLDPKTQQENKAYHIPIKLGLISKNGTPIEFKIENNTAYQAPDLLELTQQKETFKLTHVAEEPILSINRDFSAPINIEFKQSDEDLYLLMNKDADAFNRWDSAQKIYRQTLMKIYDNLKDNQTTDVPTSLIKTFKNLIHGGLETPALTARLMDLPSSQFMAEFITDLDPVILKKASAYLLETLSRECHTSIFELYQNLQNQNLGQTPEDIALRSFKNSLLNYLYRHDPNEGAFVFFEQFQNAKNMTDTLSALHRLAVSGGDLYEKAMKSFYSQWCDDNLVMNKWLTVAAMSSSENTFNDIKAKMKSDVFDRSNPNNVFALLYYFAQFNWSQFHRTSGETYMWFAQEVIEIDKLNPQVSSRLGSAFNNWRKLSPQYQGPIKKALELIIGSKPSDNLYEIISRSLA